MEADDRKELNTNEAFKRIEASLFDKVEIDVEIDDESVLRKIQNEICEYAKEYPLSIDERLVLQKRLFYSLRKYDVLSELLEDDSITEIMINGPNDIFIERNGKIEKTNKHFASSEKLDDVIQQVVGQNNQVVNETTPIVDTRLDGCRVNIVLPPISLGGSIMSIRRFSKEPITMDRLIEFGSINHEIKDFLKELVNAGYNIFISGGTGSGKTTFLNALTEFVPSDERVITIEDAAELQIMGIENLVRLEARKENMEGDLEVSIRDLVRASLRMRPNRIIVGECRGAEALEVLQACNTGHDGSLSTGHANSSYDMISRLETMVLQGTDIPIIAIRKQIASAIDIFIHLGRLPSGARRLLSINEVLGIENGEVKLKTLYEYDYENLGEDAWIKKSTLENTEKISRIGKL